MAITCRKQSSLGLAADHSLLPMFGCLRIGPQLEESRSLRGLSGEPITGAGPWPSGTGECRVDVLSLQRGEPLCCPTSATIPAQAPDRVVHESDIGIPRAMPEVRGTEEGDSRH